MIRLSYSQLNSWASCGEQYRLERIVKVPQRPAWWFIGGSAVHEATEHHDLREHGVDAPNLSFEDIFERLASEAEESSGFDRSEFRVGGRASKANPDKENDAWWLREGPAMVQRWINWTRSVPWRLWITPDGRPAVELEFDLFLDDMHIKGYIDRVYEDTTGALGVVDLKSGTSKQASVRQLGGYKVALTDMYPDAPVRWGAFWDARSGSTDAAVPLNEFDRRRLTWQYGVLAEARNRNMFLPSPSNLCGTCGVREFCYEVTPGASAGTRPPWISPNEWGDDDAA